MIAPSRISSSRSQRSASSITWLETSTAAPRVGEPVEQRPQVPAQHRVEADGRLVEHQQVGLVEQGDGEAGPGALPAAELADDLVGVAGEVDGLDAPGRPRSSPTPSTRAKKRRFSVTVRSSYTLAAWVT